MVLYTPGRYTTYLEERLETLGCPSSKATAGLNMGQKLTWLTENT